MSSDDKDSSEPLPNLLTSMVVKVVVVEIKPKTLQRATRVAPRLTSPLEGIGDCADSAMG